MHVAEEWYNAGRMKYWYVGNPNPFYPLYHYPGPYPVAAPLGPTSADWRIWDRNHSGDNRDDYMVKIGDKRSSEITIMTDQSLQELSVNTTAFGYSFLHGRNRQRLSGWKNNLFGDGHAESRRPRVSSFSADGSKYINPNPAPAFVKSPGTRRSPSNSSRDPEERVALRPA